MQNTRRTLPRPYPSTFSTPHGPGSAATLPSTPDSEEVGSQPTPLPLDSAALEYLAAKQVKLPLDSPSQRRILFFSAAFPSAPNTPPSNVSRSRTPTPVPARPHGASHPTPFPQPYWARASCTQTAKEDWGTKVERNGRVMDKAKIRAKTKARTNPIKVIGKDPP